MLERKPPQRVPGTAVFLTSQRSEKRTDRADAQPQALQSAAREERHHQRRDRHARAAGGEREARRDRAGRLDLHAGQAAVWLHGVAEHSRALAIARKLGWQFDIMSTSFFLSRRALKPAPHSGMPRWQDRLFIWLARSANDATDYFQIPTDRVVEVGTQVTV